METHLFWGQEVKGQGHNLCVGFQTERKIAAAAAYVSHAGFCWLGLLCSSECRLPLVKSYSQRSCVICILCFLKYIQLYSQFLVEKNNRKLH